MAENQGPKIEGLDEVKDRLRSLTPELQAKALRNAIRRGATTVSKAAKRKAPKDTGAMAKNIRVQFASRTFRKTGDLMFRVGVRGGAQQPGSKVRYAKSRKGKRESRATGGSTWYWRLVEFGTSRSRAKPFMRPALRENVGTIISQVASDLDKGITAALKAERRRQAKAGGR